MNIHDSPSVRVCAVLGWPVSAATPATSTCGFPLLGCGSGVIPFRTQVRTPTVSARSFLRDPKGRVPFTASMEQFST